VWTPAERWPWVETRLTQISDIVELIRGYAPDADMAPVLQGYLLAARTHEGQMRKSGEPYITHPLAVARILAEMKMDVDTIATALLHDALEDNPITREEMTAQVGPVITELVDGVTKIGKLKYRSKEELQAENFRKMILAMSKDLRVILVKLADRLHNMRTLDGHNEEKRKRIARETLDIYAPIANRLGITHLKTELEDLCIRHLDPEGWERITQYLRETQVDRDAYIQRVVAGLRGELDRHHVEGRVSGRAKAVPSVWHKMRAKSVDVVDMPDLLAFRILVTDLASCYLMLGLVHGAYEPVPERIKDYIARPKANGYQSLHTTVIGPEKQRIEIQIRTEQMHQIAEQGIAAHWRYKEGHLAIQPEEMVAISRIRDLIDTSDDEGDSAADFMESVKAAFYADEIFVFTPAGEVKQLPVGATPIDFAFAVHSDVGARCVGARVDGRIVPLNHQLHTGDKIEILTRPDQKPRRDWLEFAKTSRAISKIRRFLRQEEEDKAIEIGRNLLEGELGRFEWTIDRARSEGRLEAHLKERGHKGIEGLLAELAHGHQPLGEVARSVLPEGVWLSRQEEARRSRLSSLLNRLRGKTSRSPVLITGEDNVLVSYARCCNPLPGEEVTGFITRGRGITVHRSDCKALEQLEEDRRVPVEWDLSQRSKHSNTLLIRCADRTGILASITKICETVGVNIERAEARSGDSRGSLGQVTLQLAVADLAELTKVIRGIEKVVGVESVQRVAG
jgi:guanosine-3',5'-bis(diphosphate) 3'-pyrophosphohydrolase